MTDGRFRTGDDAERAWNGLLHHLKTWSETRELGQHAGFRIETQSGPVYVSIGRSYDHAKVDEDVAYPLVHEQPLTNDVVVGPVEPADDDF